jgi:hypothetical protein
MFLTARDNVQTVLNNEIGLSGGNKCSLRHFHNINFRGTEKSSKIHRANWEFNPVLSEHEALKLELQCTLLWCGKSESIQVLATLQVLQNYLTGCHISFLNAESK